MWEPRRLPTACDSDSFNFFYTEDKKYNSTLHLLPERVCIMFVRLRKSYVIINRKDSQAKERQALNWNPQVRPERKRPKRTWRRTVAEEIGKVGKTWKEVGVLALNRIR
jgi:hypothetical protein